MIKILALAACLGAVVFCAAQLIISTVKLKNKKDAKNGKKRENIKEQLSFKNMDFKRKRVVISLIVFLGVLILLQNIIFGFIAAGLYVYFDWYLRDKNAKKLAALIDKQVIEALTVIKNAVQSGQSLQTAMGTAGEELKEPIKSEFVKMSDNLALGVSFEKILTDAAANSPSKEFRLMIDTIKISKDTGSSLAGIFDRIIDATSQRVAIGAKVTALTAQGRMSGNVVSVIPFVVILMMYTIEPDMMASLFNTIAGNILLLIVVAMVLAGSFVIRKITEIDF
ncbi:type II secretion system F family protein [Endomicrobium proavitum]|uniref:Flp pilus assembly protein TadB n=1 Tax=Endomicrobium proavitum TaxID=1408281 RepID=A0A0G3WGK7_9BACT|nr:type II secretion system F family protein [Endomicrobium proavitum]AKL97816.1 Flp pilus assembly protein TadB [Endomicrobium proavitum]